MAEKTNDERPKTQAEQDYDERYSSARNYYGDSGEAGSKQNADRTYGEQGPDGPPDQAEPEASYDRHRYSDEELSRLSDDVHGNDEWFASGAGVAIEPFERSWSGAGSTSSPTRPASGILRSSPSGDRRVITRRDIGHDPFIERLGVDERRIQSSDRRSGSPAKTRKDRPAHFR